MWAVPLIILRQLEIFDPPSIRGTNHIKTDI
jgi:hypothetical protein